MSDLELDFDGADELLRHWSRGLTPDPVLTVSEWADRHRWLGSRSAAEPGRYRTSRTPYLREIMDKLSARDPTRRVVFAKSAQVGATEAGNNWIGYIIHHAPGPILAVQPTLDLAKRFSRQRVETLIDETPALRELIPPSRSRDSGNTMASKDFPGGVLVLTGANSAVGLRSMPARYILLDEVDAYPASLDEEGDPVALAEARGKTFGSRRKIFLISTPTVRGASRIEREYEASDQRRYFVPCPHCGDVDWLRFERLQWDWGSPETAAYVCDACGGRIEEHAKVAMLAAGEWRPTAKSQDPHTAGYHISALYSPPGWESWVDIARGKEAAYGSEESERAFKNTVLGETWTEAGDAPDWERLVDRAEEWRGGTAPAGGLILTAGADVQADRIEVDVWAWGRGLESWLVDHLVVEGGPHEPRTWAELTKILSRTWPSEGGAELTIARLAIDTGYETTAVYAWARQQGPGVVAPVKGVGGFARNSPVTGPTFVDATQGGRKIRRGARVWTVSVSVLKSETYRLLRLPRPTREELAAGEEYPAGTVHLPRWVDTEWVRQLTAEQLVTVRGRRGYTRLEWQKIRDRNEALDCRVYARAATVILGADRWSDARWSELEAQVAVTTPSEGATSTTAPAAGETRPSTWLPPRRDWL